jgi:hypothetical protein
MVAVKVIEYVQEPGQKGPLEGLLSEQVHHPNVVSEPHTLNFSVHTHHELQCAHTP